MIYLEIFFLLVLVHFVADYPLQTDFVAVNKNRHLNKTPVPWVYVMTGHCATHALGVYLVTHSLFLASLELGAHWFIDWAKCEGRTNIHVDQALHILCKLWWVALALCFSIPLGWGQQ
jgi:uncharacterized protein DUF3307